MIFGFNSDIKYADTVYHVQSEVRQNEQTLQSQVFVRGRCLGKHVNSFADKTSDPDFSEVTAHELLKSQHRDVLNAIRAGRLDELLGKKTAAETPPAVPASTPAAAASTAAAPPEANPLVLRWVKAESVGADNEMALRFCVTVAGLGVLGARVISRLDAPSHTSVYKQAETTGDGMAEIHIPLDMASAPDAALLVQANYMGMSVKHKFRLRRA